MWKWATPELRARRALWVMYKRLTSTRIHKFYTLLLLLTLLPLITLHLLALHNTSTGLTKLSILLSFTSTSASNSSSNSWEGSLVPTVIQQDGQGVLRVCNAGNVCETVTSVAAAQSATVSTSITIPTPASSSQTPQQVGSGASGGIAGDQGPSVLNTRSTTLPNAIPSSSTSSIPPSPDVVVQGATPRPQPTGSPTGSPGSPSPGSPPTTSSLVVPPLAISSQPPPVSSVQDGGVLIAAPPPTTTLDSAAPAVQTPSGSGSSTGLVVADVPLVIATSTSSTGTTSTSSATSSTSTSTSSTSSTSTSTLKKSKDGAKGGIKTESSGTTSTSTSTSTPSTSTPSTSTSTSTSPSTTSTSSSSPTPTPVSEAALGTASSAENDATINEAPSTSTSTSDVAPLVRPDFSTDLPVDGNEGPSGSTSTSTSSTSTSSTSTDTTSTQTSTTSTSSTQPDVDPTTESSTNVPTSSSSIPPESEKGGGTGGNNGSTSPTSSTSTSTTLTTTSNSDESTPTETTPTETTSTDDTSTDSTPTESKETKQTSAAESSSSNTKETDDEPTSTSTSPSSDSSSTTPSTSTHDAPGSKRALPLQRRYTGTLYGSPGSAFPLQARSYSALRPRTFSATPITNGTTGTLEGVDVTDVSDTGGNDVTRLGVVCAISMAFPLSQLRQDWMEDITMAAFYLCIFGVGIVAIINESVAHLITAFLATFLAFLWTSTQLVRTHYAHDQFDAFITRSACSGIDVLPYYWAQRQRLELPILIINVLALVFLGGLGFKLFKMYRGNMKVERRYVYKVMLVLRCSILLGSFFLFSGTGIWLNFLFTNPGVVVSGTVDMLKGLAIVSLVFGLPWAMTGWFALREAGSSRAGRGGKWLGKRMMMGVFTGLTVLFLAGWVATFASDVYRAVFLAWTFFAVVSVAAFFVLVGSLGAGVVCWMRFGRDLDDFDSEKPRGVSVVSTESFGNPVGHLSHSSSHLIGGSGGGGGGLEVPRWDYSNTAEKAWEPFDKASIRQSQFTASDGRQSTVFSYGLRSPAPPVPTRPDAYGSSSSNPNVTFGLAL